MRAVGIMEPKVAILKGGYGRRDPLRRSADLGMQCLRPNPSCCGPGSTTLPSKFRPFRVNDHGMGAPGFRVFAGSGIRTSAVPPPLKQPQMQTARKTHRQAF